MAPADSLKHLKEYNERSLRFRPIRQGVHSHRCANIFSTFVYLPG